MKDLTKVEAAHKDLLHESKFETFAKISKGETKVVIEGSIDKMYAKTILQEVANKIAAIEELTVFDNIEVNIKIK